MADFQLFDYKDVTECVMLEPTLENQLITSLGLFNEKIYTTTTSFLFDNIVAATQSAAPVVGDYDLGDYGSIVTGTAQTLMLRVPAYALESQISASAFQGHRKPGTNREKTLDDVTAEHLLSMKQRLEIAREKAMQRALFDNVIHFKGGDINIIDELGGKFQQSEDELNLGGDLIRELERVVKLVKKQMGGLVHSFGGVYLFVDSSTYDRLRYDDKDIRRAIMFGNGTVKSNMVFDGEHLPGYSVFQVDGIAITIISCDDGFMKEGYAYAVPAVRKNTFLPCMSEIVGPATRNLRYAMSGQPAREIYWLEQTNTQRKLFCESHTAYINSRPDFVFKLKLTEPVTPVPPSQPEGK